MPANRSRSPYASRKQPPARFPARPWLGVLIAGGVLLALGWVFLGNRQSGAGVPDTLTPVATLQAADYHSLAVSPQDGDRVWFGAHDGLQESTDGGRTWRPLPGVQGDAMSLARPPGDPAWVYLAGHDIFQRSTDGGQTWQAVATDLPGTDLHGFAADPANARRVYAVVAGQGVFRSDDGGTQWRATTTQPSGAVGGLAVTAGDPARVYVVAALGVMYSADDGAVWHPAGAGLPAGGTYALLTVPGQPRNLYAGTVNGLYRSTDGATWQAAGLAGQKVLALAAGATSPLRVYALTDAGRLFRLEGSTLGRAPERPALIAHISSK